MFDVAHIDEGILQKTTRQVLLWRNEQTTKNWSAYLDKNVTMEEHCQAKSAYMIDMETSNNDMTHMCWCDNDSGAYIAGEILVEEGIVEHYEVLHDEAAYWPDGQDLFAMNRESFDFVNEIARAEKTMLSCGST